MKEQLVSYKTAKLAKDKGFSLLTLYYYDFIGDIGSSSSDDQNWNQSKETIYSAPTQSSLQKWLRDERNFHLEITVNDLRWFVKGKRIDFFKDKIKGFNFPTTDRFNYKSYEEALE